MLQLGKKKTGVIWAVFGKKACQPDKHFQLIAYLLSPELCSLTYICDSDDASLPVAPTLGEHTVLQLCPGLNISPWLKIDL